MGQLVRGKGRQMDRSTNMEWLKYICLAAAVMIVGEVSTSIRPHTREIHWIPGQMLSQLILELLPFVVLFLGCKFVLSGRAAKISRIRWIAFFGFLLIGGLFSLDASKPWFEFALSRSPIVAEMISRAVTAGNGWVFPFVALSAFGLFLIFMNRPGRKSGK
jgi:hypothetical protein